MKAFIGIISYIPDDPEVRIVRLNRINKLVTQCDNLFHLPIVIIAQNWKGLKIDESCTKCPVQVFNFEKLGINKARKVLRQIFVKSSFDYIIMLDDDCDLKGTELGAMQYLAQLKPGCWGFYKPHLLKLAAISREVFSQIDYPDGGADDEDPFKRFFEDMYIHLMLKKHMPDKMIQFKKSAIEDFSDSAYDEVGNTGWHKKVYVKNSEFEWTRRFTGNNTRYMIKYSPKEALLDTSKVVRRKSLEKNEKNQMLYKN